MLLSKPMLKRLSILVLLLVSLPGFSQLFCDFESVLTSPVRISGEQAAVRDNPLKTGNPSNKVVFYNKTAGNWKQITLEWDKKIAVNKNDVLSFQINAALQGRVFIKIYNAGQLLKEDWAPRYDFRPATNQWALAEFSVALLAGKEFDKIEIFGAVDNEAQGGIYLDNLKLSHSSSPDGSPVIVLKPFKSRVLLRENIVLDASESFSPEDDITASNWSLGNGIDLHGLRASFNYDLPGIYPVVLTLTTAGGKTKSRTILIYAIDPDEKISRAKIDLKSRVAGDYFEGIFVLRDNYKNVFDPDEVKVDAEITRPDGSIKMVPAFFYVKGYYAGGQWLTDSTEQHWMFRFTDQADGNHKVRLILEDKDGISRSGYTEFRVEKRAGVILSDKNNRQFYKKSSNEQAYIPLGINVGWDSIEDYTTIFNNLADGGANLARYWVVPFNRQALEWKNDGYTHGLGKYSQAAAAFNDSLFAIADKRGLNLQMVLFQHGMFSENVNSNWSDNPYNKALGGPLQKPEEFFYHAEAKKYTKKLLRYIVARWGYSSNLFAWELFNEVQFTGNHPNQSAAWKQGVLDWHSEMAKEIKALDAFNHLVTTSASDEQILQMDKLEGLDVLQYHVYNTNLINSMLAKNSDFKSKLAQKAIICGEYGLDVNTAATPMDVQRVLIWAGIFTQVPHLMWLWDDYVKPEWGQLFKYPAKFLTGKDFVKERNLKTWPFVPSGALTGLGFSTDKARYGFVFHNQHQTAVSGTTVKFDDLPDGLYNIRYTDILSGVETVVKKAAFFGQNKTLSLPRFDKGLVFELEFDSPLTKPVGIITGPEKTGQGKETVFSAAGSFIPAGLAVTYQWRMVEKPQNSKLILHASVGVDLKITPDQSGKYTLGLTLIHTGEMGEEKLISFTADGRPVARAGNNRISKAGESVDLDGSASSDIENDPLTYNWQLISAPAGSRKVFNFQSQVKAQLLTDLGGDYLVSLTVSDGYSYSLPDTVTIKTEQPLANENPLGNTEIQAYPNPTRGKVYLEKPLFAGDDLTLSLTDLSGKQRGQKIFKNGSFAGDKLEISINDYGIPEGTYLIRVSNEKYSRTYKVIYLRN